MKDKKRFFIRLATVLVLIGIAVLMYFLGRGASQRIQTSKLPAVELQTAAQPEICRSGEQQSKEKKYGSFQYGTTS